MPVAFAPIDLWRAAQTACTCRAQGSVASLHLESCGVGVTYRRLMVLCGLARMRDPDEPARSLDEPLLPCGITPRSLRARDRTAS